MHKTQDEDIKKPDNRKLLPDAHPSYFGAQTSSFVIHDKDIENETVFGKEFDKEIAQGKIFVGRMGSDERCKGFDKLIDDVDNMKND